MLQASLRLTKAEAQGVAVAARSYHTEIRQLSQERLDCMRVLEQARQESRQLLNRVHVCSWAVAGLALGHARGQPSC